MAQHYVIVLVPQQGEWRAHIPDFRGCRAEGARVEAAIDIATREVSDMLDGPNHQGAIIPPPKSYEDVRADDAWAAERGIDWSSWIACGAMELTSS